MGAPNRDAAVAASSFIVTHIVVATTQFLIVRAATKRRYRRCCPLLWRCFCHRNDVCAAVVTMRSVFPGTAALARAWNLQNAETRLVKPTENPLTFLITAALSPSRRARLTIFKSYYRV